jgi:hypothetical protein
MTLAAPFSAYMAQIIGSSGGHRICEVECPHRFIFIASCCRWNLALLSSHFSMIFWFGFQISERNAYAPMVPFFLCVHKMFR